MPDVDLHIRGGEPDVAVDDGRVVAVGRELDFTARETVDATGLHVLAGAVDAHVHFNDPGRADWEGWATGTAAAAAGGTTCVIDMPLNAHPPTVDAAAFRAKLDAASAAAVTDFALWGGLVPGNVPRMAELAELGVVGFKAFMSPSGIDDFAAADDDTLRPAWRRRRGSDCRSPCTPRPIRRCCAAPRPRLARLRREPAAEAELEAIARAIRLAEAAALLAPRRARLHGPRRAARHRGPRARRRRQCETCPHYFVLDEDDLVALGAVAKCAPPLRARAEVDDLRAELAAGSIDLVASDHSPSPPAMKEGDDAFAVWGGISGCQSLVSLDAGRGLPPRARERAPRRAFPPPGKGRLEPGADADVVLVAPARVGAARGRPALPPQAQPVRRSPPARPRRPRVAARPAGRRAARTARPR